MILTLTLIELDGTSVPLLVLFAVFLLMGAMTAGCIWAIERAADKTWRR